MMSRFIRFFPIAALLVSAPVAAQHADPGAGMSMPGMEQMHADMMTMQAYAPSALLVRKDALSLTADQVIRLQALADEAKQAGDKAKADHDSHHAMVVKMFEQSATDAAQVTQHAQAAMQAMTAGCVAEMTAAAKAKNVLTPEQRGRVQGRLDAMQEMHKDGMPEMRHEH
jgi:hypothetical protein